VGIGKPSTTIKERAVDVDSEQPYHGKLKVKS
jgi:hypothetical protein